MTIYAADDEPLMLEMLTEAINEAVPNGNPKCFGSSTELLAEAEKAAPDVAFLDVEMPEMNGIELAKRLKEINPFVNIIFVTGYSQYGVDAMQLFASGYILKPVDAESIKTVMENLRFAPSEEKKVRVQCFGNFSVSVDGDTVNFRFKKSEELLAYLVDRHGAYVSRKEAAAVLFEDDDYSRAVQNELGRAARWLTEDLSAVGAESIFISENGKYRVDTERISCDLFDYMEGKNKSAFMGEYMEQYSWGEYRKGVLENIL